MIRVFQVYYPVRTLVLLAGEAAFACLSFLVAALIQFGPDSYVVLNYEAGFAKIVVIVTVVVICAHYFDLYAPYSLGSTSEIWFRILLALSTAAFAIAAIGYFFPHFMMGRHVYLYGLSMSAGALLLWRMAYTWFSRQPYLCERVYVLGSGDRANRLVNAIRTRRDLGMEIVGWAGALGSEAANRERLGDVVQGLLGRRAVDRVIVALPEGRGTLPVSELLQLRLTGAVIEEASSLLEKISGKIEVDSLRPSALIYADGFRLRPRYRIVRRALSFTVAFCALAVCAPLLPFIALAIKLSSPGPVLFSQTRVGRGGEPFTLYKFRSMRNDAEQVTGAVWAQKNDSRVTRVGQFLRRTRLDEIPQLWNVLRGDMNFVGPRPERPEFVCWLVDQIPYYNLRHIVRPGVTGWAQIRYRYGASVQDSKEKLEYDLYYIKHFSLALDLLIMFETIKTIILRRGAQ